MPPTPKPTTPLQRLSNWFAEQRAMFNVQVNWENQTKLLRAGFAEQDAKEQVINSKPGQTADEKRRDFIEMKHSMGNESANFHEWNKLHMNTVSIIDPITSFPENRGKDLKHLLDNRGKVGTFFGKLFTGRIFSRHMNDATALNLRWSEEARSVNAERDELGVLNERITAAAKAAPAMGDAQKEVERLVRAGVDPKQAQNEVMREDRGSTAHSIPTKTVTPDAEGVTLEDLDRQVQVQQAVRAGVDPKVAYKAVYEPETAPVQRAEPAMATPEMQSGGMSK